MISNHLERHLVAAFREDYDVPLHQARARLRIAIPLKRSVALHDPHVPVDRDHLPALGDGERRDGPRPAMMKPCRGRTCSRWLVRC